MVSDPLYMYEICKCRPAGRKVLLYYVFVCIYCIV